VTTQVELEFKLRVDGEGPSPADLARTAAAVGIRLRERAPAHHEDRYFDTADGWLAQAGIGLRLRASRKARVLCVKAERDRERADGPFCRDETELPFAGEVPAAARDLPAALRDAVEPFTFDRPLQTVARLRTERRVLRAKGLEVALDRVAVDDPCLNEVGSFVEVEIEVLDPARTGDAQRLAEALRGELGLGSTQVNKLGRALAMLGASQRLLEPGPVGPDLGIEAAADQVLLRHFLRMQREEVRVRSSGSADGVHKLRVACRRMRAALRTFAPWIAEDERRRYGRALRATATAFGATRDLDVLADELKTRVARLPTALHKPARRMIARLRRLSSSTRSAGIDGLGAAERLAGLAALRGRLGEPGHAVDQGRVRDLAPQLLREAAAEVFEQGRGLGPRAPAESLHRLRILMKRLRYAAECFVDAFGKDLVRFVERTAHLQEVLGEFHDASVAVTTLLDLTRQERDLGRRELCAAGALCALEELRAAEARARFDGIWAEFDHADVRTWLEAVLRSPVGS
jgi:CHAD domain-containing protein/adenylate cyclase class IV